MSFPTAPLRLVPTGLIVDHHEICTDGITVRDAALTREGEEALWQAVFTAAPERRREFEPSSKRRKRRPAPWPCATG